jgi:hypothetical protein
LYTLSQQEREGRAPLFAYKRTITLVVYHQVFRFARGFYEFFSTFFEKSEYIQRRRRKGFPRGEAVANRHFETDW